MLDLLKWRMHPERISDSLSKLKEIDGSEIVKVDYRPYCDYTSPMSMPLVMPTVSILHMRLPHAFGSK